MLKSNNALKNETKSSVKVTAYFLCIIFVLSFIEIGSYLLLSYEDQIKKIFNYRPKLDLGLDIYEIPDYEYPHHWRLKSGSSFTLRELIQAKNKSGRILGAKMLEKNASHFNTSLNEVLFHINKKGFKGPEIIEPKTRLRILSLGDSCTFGSVFDKYCYPRILEKKLKELGNNVEVINAGVQGYAPYNIVCRIEEFKSLKPDITTIYIGWNALYDKKTIHSLYKQLNSIILLKRLLKKLKTMLRTKQTSLEEYNKLKVPNIKDPLLNKIENYIPWFYNDLMRIINEFQEIGSKVVLITLPGLYSMNRIPDKSTLEKGHLPTYTNNPYVIAKLTTRYNNILKQHAGLCQISLVNLEKWCESNLQPVESYFIDSVHLDENGQTKIGLYLANQLVTIFPDLFRITIPLDKR